MKTTSPSPTSKTVVLDLLEEQGPSKVITVGPNGSNPASVFPQAIPGGKGNHCSTCVAISHQCHCFWAPTLAAPITADHHKINTDVNTWG